ncbi:ankyrin repeat and SOCS box protein 10 [Bombina bombina]|uniref:ankyrin repeat and SOCS box protein 10 n=1 Tax=Bombina bombina TaxID=8345 RepID=UPI00235A8B52|nr:ankyrin repeat and SOCS box protein 10 [Bombina bombina]
MSFYRFPFSSCALRSLQEDAEQQERWELRKRMSRGTRKYTLPTETEERSPMICTDPIIHNALFSGDISALQGFQRTLCSPKLLLPTRNHNLRWSSQQTGIWSMTYEEEFTCPLYVTASRGYTDCLQLLLKEGADVDFSPGGESALHGACENAHSECVNLLLRYGANPNSVSQDGTLPLHLCKASESYNCAKLLLQYGAHVNSQSHDDEDTPLHVASKHGLWELVELYLSYGANVDKKNAQGETPLCAACSHPQNPEELERYYMVCKRIIEDGANIHACDNDQQSPLHLACKSVNPRVVDLLLSHGSQVNAMSYSGNTAMHNILQVTAYKLQNQPELIARMLLNHGTIRVWPGALVKVLRYCSSSPRTVEVLLNTYSYVRVTEEWADAVPEEQKQVCPTILLYI